MGKGRVLSSRKLRSGGSGLMGGFRIRVGGWIRCRRGIGGAVGLAIGKCSGGISDFCGNKNKTGDFQWE